ncbi:MAG: trypsin-like peptidase domain-containing protein, partial [Clostridia bacterium]|nr:trypsin-like peptidase domain-containing protein [Clostridia bacterium]
MDNNENNGFFPADNDQPVTEPTATPASEPTPIVPAPDPAPVVEPTPVAPVMPQPSPIPQTQPQPQPAPVAYPQGAPQWNRINFTEQKPVKEKAPFNRGIIVFCGVLAVIILLTAACAGGYFLGKNTKGRNLYNSEVKVDLAAKPKDVDGKTAAEVYDEINPSIVGIRVYNSSAAYDASGVIYTEDGYIITNDHIYENVGAPRFKIYTYDGKEYDAEYVAGDSVSDLAVIKIKNGSGFTAAVFGDSKEIVCGETVYAIGRPSDAVADTSITAGIVSAKNRRVKSKTNYSSSLIQTDSAINPGSSGGALVNMYCQVVGITCSKQIGSDYDSVSYSIPSHTVKRVVDQLISGGKVTDRAKIGITYTEVNSVVKEVQKYSATGILVQSVNADSDLYGKVEKGDIITHINDIEVVSDDVVLDVIENCKAGDMIKIKVLSASGDENTYNVKLGANVGESSYKANESDVTQSGGNSNDPGTFDFPNG